MLFSPLIQEEEEESVRHRFLSLKTVEVTKHIRLPPIKPDFKLIPPQNTQILDLKRAAYTEILSTLNLSCSFIRTPASNWNGEKCSQVIKLNK